MQRDVSSCNTYNYGDALYWDARYVQDALSFDWYQRYSSLRPFVRSFVPTSSRVLMVGCGNSRNSLFSHLLLYNWHDYEELLPLMIEFDFRSIQFSNTLWLSSLFGAVMSEDMVKDGYEDIMNVDISSVAIEMMQTKYASVPQLKCTLFFFCISNFNYYLLSICKAGKLYSNILVT